jgi:hypothetical protein
MFRLSQAGDSCAWRLPDSNRAQKADGRRKVLGSMIVPF